MNLSWCHVDRYEEDSDAQKTAKQLTKIKLEIWQTLLTAMLFKVDWKGRWHDVRKRKCARGSKTDKLLIWPADKMSYSSFGWKEYLFFLLFFVLIGRVRRDPGTRPVPNFFSSTQPVPTRKLKMTGYRVIRFHFDSNKTPPRMSNPANWMTNPINPST